jgi:hypothetical protein
VPPQFTAVRFVGLSNSASCLCYVGDGSAIRIGDSTANTNHHGVAHLQIDLTCAGPSAAGLTVTPSHYCHLLHSRFNSQALYTPATMQQTGLVLDGAGYTGSFGANFYWESNVIKGRFKRGVHMKASQIGFGYNACQFNHGTIIWESLSPPSKSAPAGHNYYGFHMEQGNQNLAQIIDVEHYEIGWMIESFDNVFLGTRTEYSRTKGMRFAAERTGVTTGGTYCRVMGAFHGEGIEDQTGTSQIWASGNVSNFENHITHYAYLDTTLSVHRNFPVIWEGSTGSSALIWRDEPGGPGVGYMGVFGDKKLNLHAGLSQLLECAGSISNGSTTLTLSVYPGQTVAVEPTAADIGKKIVVERALDGRKPLVTTISNVTATPATHTLGTIAIITTTETITDGSGQEVEVTTTTLQGSATYWTIALNGKTITIGGNDYTFQYSSPTRGFLVETYPGPDAEGVSYSIAYNTYSLTLAAAAGATVSGVTVQYGTAAQFIARYDKSILLKAHGSVLFQIASITKLAIDLSGFTFYAPLEIIGNQGITWSTLGGSAGLSWQIAHPTQVSNPYIHGLLINNTDAMELRAGESRVDKDLVIEAAHPDAQILMRIAGTNKLTIDQNGVSGTLTTVTVQGNNNFTNITASEFVRVQASSPPPLFITRNTHATQTTGGLDMGWNSARQWLVSAGVPSATSTALAIAEYTDDVYQGARMMLFKGGNVAIGSTSDDGNRLHVNGNTKLHGDLAVTYAITAGALTVTSSTPLIILRNNDGGGSHVGGLDLGWSAARQWLVSAGLPASSGTALAFAEYTDDAFVAIRLMLFKGGNIVIGATTDDGSHKLQVTGSAKITGILSVGNPATTSSRLNVESDMSIASYTSDEGGPLWIMRKRGATGGGSSIKLGAYLALNHYLGYETSDYHLGAAFDVVAEENWTSGGHGVMMRWYTCAVGSTAANARMAISSNGNVLIATLTDSGSGEKLQVNGDVRVSGNIKPGNNSTGSGSAALGSNCPATTVSAPYTWIRFTAADGSAVWVPAWK